MNPAVLLTSTIEAKSHDNPLGIDVVSPEKLETLLDLGEVGMRMGVWTERLDILIPNTIYSLISRSFKAYKWRNLRISYVMMLNQSRYFSMLTMSNPLRYQYDAGYSNKLEGALRHNEHRTYQRQGQAILVAGRIKTFPQAGQEIHVVLKVFFNATSVFCDRALENVSMK